MTQLTIQAIGKTKSDWGEGALWSNDTLLYVDINGKKIVRLDPGTGKEEVWNMPERVGTVVPDTKGSFIYAGDLGITRFDPETGSKTLLADPEPEKRETNRFNDGKCDPAGRFWAGTISLVKNEGDAALYTLNTDGTLQVKLDSVTNSNGICWSQDKQTMYYIDTPTQKIDAFDYSLKTGEITNRRCVIDTAAKGFTSSPDGMTIDSNGNLWVAFCHGGCVACFDPINDTLSQKVDLPCLETTSCAFGGSNLDRLFVTTGIHKSIEEPDAGRIFVIDGLGITGVPTYLFQS